MVHIMLAKSAGTLLALAVVERNIKNAVAVIYEINL